MSLDHCLWCLLRIAELQPGRDSYHAAPPSELARMHARACCEHACVDGPPPTRVAPTSAGGVLVRFGAPDRRRRVVVEFYYGGRAHALFDPDPIAESRMTRAVEPTLDGLTRFLHAVQEFLDDEPDATD